LAYQPASVLSTDAGLQHLSSVTWYERVGVENLKAHLPFPAVTERKKLPFRNGKDMRLFSYNTLAANTTPGTEGTVGTGIAPGTVTRSVSISQYFDFMSFSDLIEETAIDPIVENSAAELGYRAALTVNTLTSTEFDVAAGVAGTTIDLSDNEFMSAAIVRQAVMSLRGQNARPKPDGWFHGIIHPFPAFDLLNDNTAGGVIDVLKHVESGKSELQRGIQGFRVIEIAGVRFVETTTVPTTSNFPSASKTGYHTYIVGKDAIFSVSLGSTEIPGERNFRLMVNSYKNGSVADPAGVIGSSIAYNFKYAAIRRPGTVMTLRRVRSEASIS
jgi:N4-gp56 family major capsid protein